MLVVPKPQTISRWSSRLLTYINGRQRILREIKAQKRVAGVVESSAEIVEIILDQLRVKRLAR